MTFPRTWVVVACFACFQAFAQSSPDRATAATNSAAPPAAPSTTPAEPAMRQDLGLETKATPETKALVPSKPVKKIWRVPLQIAKDLNPLAPMEPRPRLPVPRTGGPSEGVGENRPKGGLSPRAWTTTVGWHPGQSAFPDPALGTAWP